MGCLIVGVALLLISQERSDLVRYLGFLGVGAIDFGLGLMKLFV
jgi:hypothetical protein